MPDGSTGGEVAVYDCRLVYVAVVLCDVIQSYTLTLKETVELYDSHSVR